MKWQNSVFSFLRFNLNGNQQIDHFPWTFDASTSLPAITKLGQARQCKNWFLNEQAVEQQLRSVIVCLLAVRRQIINLSKKKIYNLH